MNTTTTTPEGAGEFPPLKPCPFCGHVGLDFREGSTFRWLDSSCAGCGASTGETRIQTLGQGTKEEWMADAKRDAIAAWNRRAQAAEGEPSAPEAAPAQAIPERLVAAFKRRNFRVPSTLDEAIASAANIIIEDAGVIEHLQKKAAPAPASEAVAGDAVENYPLNRADARRIVHALESSVQSVLGDVSHEQYKAATGWRLAQRLRAFVNSGTFYPDAAPTGSESGDAVRETVVSWIVEQWHAEVADRPLVNIHRQRLDNKWRELLDRFAVDHRARLGPTHMELVEQAALQSAQEGASHG